MRGAPVIAIIGGGFTGAAIAWHLDRMLSDQARPALFVIEPREALGMGLAYSTPDPDHRINVPASRMSLDPDAPGDFERWLAEQGALIGDPEAELPDGRRFPRRALFGAYVGDALAPALATGRVRHCRTHVTGVERLADRYRLVLGNGASLDCDLIVVATTHPPPSLPGILRDALSGDPRLVADATSPGSLDSIGRFDRVLIVGTGLTMADIVAALAARQHQGPITAFSRRGQVSQPHAPELTGSFGDFLSLPSPSARVLVRRIRATVHHAEMHGLPWQAVFDTLRQQGQAIWRALPLAERRRLVRHLRPFWDARRFRIAPQIHDTLTRLREHGQLAVHAGAAVHAEADRIDIRVTLRPRNGSASIVIHADRVVMATGPAHRDLLKDVPYLRGLAEQGLIRADAVGLGLDTDERGRAIGRTGLAIPTLFIGGPLARGTFGELMGLPEVSRYAADVASEIAAWTENRGQRLTA